MEDLKASVGVDIDGFLTGMARANKSLQDFKDQAARFKGALDKATDPTSIIRLNRAIAAANEKIKAIGGAGLTGLKSVSKDANTAGVALQNVGRVAQDFQFGFQGIANNLNPLLESFQRLQKESGGTKAAFKALAGSLMGAGGIGLALSLAIPIIGGMTSGFGAWTRGLTGNKKALDENTKSAKDAADAYKAIVDSLAQEASSIAVIVEQLKNGNLSRKQTVSAIEELQRIAPQYFATLNAEKASIEQITAAYNLYSAAILRAIQAKVTERQLEDVTSRILDLQRKGKQVTEDQVGADGKLVRSNISRMATQEDITEEIKKGTTAYESFQRTVQGTAGLSIKENRELNELIKTQTILVRDLSKIKPLDFKIKGDTKGSEKDIETINDVFAKMRAELLVLNKIELTFGTDETQNKIKLLEKTIEELFTKFKLGTKNPYIIGLEFEIAEFKLTEFSNKILKGDRTLSLTIPTEILFDINEAKARQALREKFLPFTDLPNLQIDIPVKLDFSKFANASDIANAEKVAFIKGMGIGKAMYNGMKTAIEGLPLPELNIEFDKAKEAEARAKQAAQTINSIFTDSLAGLGEAIGESIATGGDLGKAIFGNLFQIISAGLAHLGKAMIAMGTAKIALEKFHLAPGIGTVIAGIATVALAQILKAALPKFDTGGFVGGGSSGASILATLHQGEYIMRPEAVARFGRTFFDRLNSGLMIPKMATGGFVGTNSIGGGQTIQVEVVGRMRGKDIYFSNINAGRVISLNG